MSRYSVDFTAPETVKLLADLPFAGQAAVVVRRIDPLWQTEIGEPRDWEVLLEKWHGCNCCYCEPEIKSLTIEAETGDEAREIAERDWPEWEVARVRLPNPWLGINEPRIEVPEEFYEKASAIWEARHALAAATGTAETRETAAQCEASQSGGSASERNAQPSSPSPPSSDNSPESGQ